MVIDTIIVINCGSDSFSFMIYSQMKKLFDRSLKVMQIFNYKLIITNLVWFIQHFQRVSAEMQNITHWIWRFPYISWLLGLYVKYPNVSISWTKDNFRIIMCWKLCSAVWNIADYSILSLYAIVSKNSMKLINW